jgi:trehalose synthase
MLFTVDPDVRTTLADYEAYSHLAPAVADLREAAREPVRRLNGRTVWMVNSTAQGGGVAEMLPKMVGLLRELGVDARWAVIQPEEDRFFTLTKRLHNLIHGSGDPHVAPDDAEFYAAISRELADRFAPQLGPRDVLVVHDPQPAGMGALLRERTGVRAVWRCHIGLDTDTAATRAAWDFLRPWTEPYDRSVFTLPEYVPGYLADRAEIVTPAVDPLSHKNRPLSAHKLAGVLVNTGLLTTVHPVVTPPFAQQALRLQPDGGFGTPSQGEDVGLLYRPIVTQVSRWDRLKGWIPLLLGFAHLKRGRLVRDGLSTLHRRRLDLARLVLAGPDPASIQDDPEGLEVFQEICATWRELDPDVQRDVAILSLPMASPKANALMVNALQRCSTVVAQNSLQEGFGLTVTEAMWKGCPVLGSRAAGVRAQIQDGETGRLVDAADPHAVAEALDGVLEAAKRRDIWGRNATRRVYDHYLVFTQVRRWLEILSADPDA